jgi:hypothetical protein
MTALSPRRRWLLAPGAAACLALAACSGGSTTSAGTKAPVASGSPTSSAPVPPAGSPNAAAALHRSVTATKAVRSYRFNAEQRVTGGPAVQVSRLSGRVLRPASLTYTLVSGGHTEQVVRLGGVTYRRIPPGRYKRLVKATRAVDPLGSVTAILTRLSAVTSAPAAAGTDFSGSLSGADAAAAGVVGNAAPGPGLTVPVRVHVDRSGRVTRLELSAPLQAGSSRLLLRQVTTYGGFNHQPPIARPR